MNKFLMLTAAVAAALLSARAGAQSFSIGNGQTVTAAQTLAAGQSGSVAAGGTLSVAGSKNAIAVQGTATIDNAGTITQTGTARAIRDTGSDVALTLTLTNEAGATISAAANDAVELQFGDDNIVFANRGTVTATGSSNQAVNLNHVASGSNVVSNYATGLIQSTAADAVRPGVNGVVNNGGIIKVNTPAGDTSSSDGVDAQSNSGITIANAVLASDPANGSGRIEGERHGITGGNTSASGSPIGLYAIGVSNAAGFVIQGDNGAGINIDGVGVSATTGAYDVSGNDPAVTSNEIATITNDGSIIGNGVTRDGDGIDVDGLVEITNTGTIRSQCAAGDTSEGVTVGGGTITNRAGGVIEGDNTAGKYGCNPTLSGVTGTGRAITIAGVDHDVNNNDAPIVPTQAMYGYTTIDNFGTIFGDSDAAIAFTGSASQYLATVINEAGATIEGAGATQAAISTGANRAVVINSGTIKADASGVAIDLGTGDGVDADSVQIYGGAAEIDGNLAGASASPSTLVIVPNASYTYTPNAAYQYNAPTGSGSAAITASGNRFTYGGAISRFSSVEFGAGTTVLTAASVNTYPGSSTIDAGATLQLDGSIAGSQTTVAGTLIGSGSIGAVEIANGGEIHAGDSAGDVATLTTGDLTLDDGATATFDLGASAGSSDRLHSTGTVNVGNAALALRLPAAPAPGVYTVIDGSAVHGGSGASVTFAPALPASLVATVSYGATAVTVDLQSVTSVALQAAANPADYGQRVTFTATVAGTLPSGSVTFFDGANVLGSGNLSGNTATFDADGLAVGMHTISAAYVGDAANAPSASSGLALEIDPAASSVALTSTPNPSTSGQTVTFTATVSGQAPSGTVAFLDGTTSLCAAATLGGNGVATCTTATLAAGSHSVTATYGGDTNNRASTSSGVAQTVQFATTTALSTACATTFVENQPFTLQATVAGSNPTGAVTFRNGSTVLCSNVALASGSASCTASALAVVGNDALDTYALSASYGGDAQHAASAAGGLQVTVLRAADVVFRGDFEAESAACPVE